MDGEGLVLRRQRREVKSLVVVNTRPSHYTGSLPGRLHDDFMVQDIYFFHN